jgi:hypothetical protein
MGDICSVLLGVYSGGEEGNERELRLPVLCFISRSRTLQRNGPDIDAVDLSTYPGGKAAGDLFSAARASNWLGSMADS